MSFPTFRVDDLNKYKYIVVDVYTTWCGPCKKIAPDIKKFSEKYSNVKFLKLDAEKYSDLADKYKIETLPTFLFFKSGKEVDRVEGANVKKVEDILSNFSR